MRAFLAITCGTVGATLVTAAFLTTILFALMGHAGALALAAFVVAEWALVFGLVFLTIAYVAHAGGVLEPINPGWEDPSMCERRNISPEAFDGAVAWAELPAMSRPASGRPPSSSASRWRSRSTPGCRPAVLATRPSSAQASSCARRSSDTTACPRAPGGPARATTPACSPSPRASAWSAVTAGAATSTRARAAAAGRRTSVHRVRARRRRRGGRPAPARRRRR